MIKNQRGYLALVAVALILFVGLVGVVSAYLYANSAIANNEITQADKALYIAEGGLEKAVRYVMTPSLSGAAGRIACSSVTGNSNLSANSLGDGTFTVTGSATYVGSTLSSTITSSATTISAANASGFASSGRLMIDKEIVNYTAISGNNFMGVTRGVNLSTAFPHTSGAYISQYQCAIDSKGGIPNLVSPVQQRELQEAIQLQEGWVVGNRSSNNFVLTHWNQPTELQWTSGSFTDATNRQNLNAVTMSSYREGFAVGDEQNNNFTILQLTNGAWSATPFAGACNSQHLQGVSIVSSTETWAVGTSDQINNFPSCNSGNFIYAILRWNGSTWTKLTSSSVPTGATLALIPHLNAVHVISTNGTGVGNLGFAVGNNGRILKYDGTSWTTDTSGITNNLFGVYVVSANEAWAVGAAGRILKWDGSTWSTVTSPTSTQLNAIMMLDTNNDGTADAGWAVGNSGVAIQYNGSTWSSQNAGGVALRGVALTANDDAWAVGNGGRVAHWDGSAWTNFTSNVSTQLNGIALIPPKQYPVSSWQEIFN